VLLCPLGKSCPLPCGARPPLIRLSVLCHLLTATFLSSVVLGFCVLLEKCVPTLRLGFLNSLLELQGLLGLSGREHEQNLILNKGSLPPVQTMKTPHEHELSLTHCFHQTWVSPCLSRAVSAIAPDCELKLSSEIR
jgi:hypothetical protein